MSTSSSDDNIFDVDAVRQFLENDPEHKKQLAVSSLFYPFMRYSNAAIDTIIHEIGGKLIQPQQAGAKPDLENGTFRSSFGLKLPKFEIRIRVTGTVIGEEVILEIQEDEIILCRLSTASPDWTTYKTRLVAELKKRLHRQINTQ